MNKQVLIAAATCLFVAQAISGSQLPQAVTQYLNNPTDANAKHAISSIPPDASGIELSSTDLLLIRNQVVAGSESGLSLVFTLIPFADGGSLEDLMALAAAAIRPQPNTFLRVVYELGPDLKTLESILLMPGLEYIDRPIAKRFELEMRRIAISGSGQQDLKATRLLCIQLLDAKLKH